MAALIGWDQAVVERASKRCAELFQESMLFRAFQQGEDENENSYFTETLGTGDEPVTEEDGRLSPMTVDGNIEMCEESGVFCVQLRLVRATKPILTDL